MEALFSALTAAVEGTAAIALGASFVWGILSILLSPCHLGSIPLIVGFIQGQGQITTRRAFVLASVFAGGILVTIALIGVITAAMGRMMGDVGPWGNYFVALIFLLVGLYLLDVIQLNLSGAQVSSRYGSGLVAALVLGLVFGVALGPCTFAYMAPMLAVALTVGATAPLYAAALLLAYGIGHCAVIVAAGTSAELVQGYLDWNERSRGTIIVKRICGALVILAGLYMIHRA